LRHFASKGVNRDVALAIFGNALITKGYKSCTQNEKQYQFESTLSSNMKTIIAFALFVAVASAFYENAQPHG
jgi:uncharacterized membrane protein YidH (DUF202 family)